MDSEGDIWVRWDVVTGDGISPRLFLQNVQAYSSALSNAGATVFPDDDAAEAARRIFTDDGLHLGVLYAGSRPPYQPPIAADATVPEWLQDQFSL